LVCQIALILNDTVFEIKFPLAIAGIGRFCAVLRAFLEWIQFLQWVFLIIAV